MKMYVDKRRVEYTFKEGDMLLVKLSPHRHVSVVVYRSKKLSKRFHDPFAVLRQIGKVFPLS